MRPAETGSSAVGALALRPARDADAWAIADVHVRSWRASYRGMLDDAVLDGLDVEGFARVRRERLAHPGGPLTDVAEDAGGTVVGFVTHGASRDLDVRGRVAEVWAVYVDPAVTGSGVGRRLLQHATGQLARFWDVATLWTMCDNVAARGFYEHLGWRADGATRQERAWYGSPRELRYRLPLAPGQAPARGADL